MKIYKFAQSGGGKIIVELITDTNNGTFRYQIAGHKEGASCIDGLDKELLEDLLHAEVDGFGDVHQKVDEGKTGEYYDTVGHKKGIPARPQETKTKKHDDLIQTPQDNKKLDLQFGV